MSVADTNALIERLQRSNRRWKWLALSLLATLGLAILLSATSAAVLSIQAAQQRRQAEAAEVEARMQAEKALRQEQNARKAVEETLKELDKLQQKGRQP
jgi:hypothetical protein